MLQSQPASTQPASTKPAESPQIGKPIDRVDGRLKVTGAAKYAADFPIGNFVHAVAFQSRIGSGAITSIDATAARRMPGVIAIMTHENAPRLFRVSLDHSLGKPGQTYLPLQDDQIHYAGQYVGVVIAMTLEQARDAADAVKVEYDPRQPIVHLDDAISDAFVPSKMGRGDKPTHERGKPDEAFAAAALKVEQTYITPIENHNPMEMHATIAEWTGDKLMLYDATQWVYGVRGVVSTWLGLSGDSVSVVDPYVGGGFGCKGSIWPHVVLSALAAKHVRRPVKLVLTRAQMFSCVGYRPRTIQRVALGADAGGKLSSIIHDCTSQTSIWKDEWVETATKQTRMLYSCSNVRTTQKLVAVNANTATQMRAPGHATGTFALETAMDELAYAAGIDPIELRLLNYAEKDEEESAEFSSKALRECYKQGAEQFGWNRRHPKPNSMRDGEWLIGLGMATATYPTNQAEASASVTIKADGTAIVKTAAHDLGTGAYTVLTQLAAETLGLDVSQISVELANTKLPEAPVAGGSQTTASVGSAVKVAAQKAIAALMERATADPNSLLFSKSAKSLAVKDGRVFLKDSPTTGETFEAILKRNGGRAVEGKGSAAPPAKAGTEEGAQSAAPREQFSKHAWGAQFAEVRIHPRLREIRVTRLVGAFAGGRILNAKTARSQLLGGIVMGVGMALHEETIYDPRTAKVVNDNLADYLVPVNPDIPPIDIVFVEEKDTRVNAIGVKGIGELGVTGIAAAISNAVYHATGVRVRNLPITLDKVL